MSLRRLRVVSWNIELGRNLRQAADELTSTAALADADILLVQEMDPDGADYLGQLLGTDVRYYAAASHPQTGLPFGNAVLSRWPMSDAHGLDLPHTARVQGQPRAAVSAHVDVAGVRVLATSVHLETVLLGLRRRIAQLATVAEELAVDTSHPLVVGGDFNSASSRSLRAFDAALAQADILRATHYREPSFTRFGQPYALDHICARGLEATRSGVEAEPTASDHQPVWAEFDLSIAKAMEED